MTVEQAIKTSIEYENKVRDFYVDAVRKTGDPAGKALFKLMAEEEQHHVDYLVAKLKEWHESGRMTAEGLRTAIPPREVVEEGIAKLHATMTGERGPSEIELLEKAYAAETETSGFYRKMVGELPREAKPLFSRFLEIEDGHLAIVQAQLDLLSGTGYWFDVREFNLEE